MSEIYKKICPTCKKDIIYKSYQSLWTSKNQNSVCKICKNIKLSICRKGKPTWASTHKKEMSMKTIGKSKNGLSKSENPTWKGCGEISSTIFKQIQRSAISRNIPFNITIEDMDNQWKKQDGKCALSGINLIIKYGKTTASLDRINSLKGYTINNIQWVHKDINRMKNTINETSFIQFCTKISEYQFFKDIKTPIDIFIEKNTLQKA